MICYFPQMTVLCQKFMFVKNSTKNLQALPEVFSKKVCMLPGYLKMRKSSLSSNLEDHEKFPERNKNNYLLNDRHQVTFQENPTIRFSTKLKCVNFAPKIARTGVI